jgi:N-acetylglucosamine-6-phosphate deacetylase
MPDLDLSAYKILPGFIDIHVHGAMGYDVMDAAPRALAAISEFKLAQGCTAYCPTTITSRRERTIAAVENIRRAQDAGGHANNGARIIGAFLEGPYINPIYRGAHPEKHIKKVSLHEMSQLFDIAQGSIVSLAVAPELPKALDAIREWSAHGINVRMGHTAATYEEGVKGIEAGANIAIHTYNAMSGFSHRSPGMVGAIMDSDKIYAELIADFVHTHVAAARILFKVKGAGKIILVTDAMNATGMPDGMYKLGETDVIVKDGIARTPNGVLAGSTLTMQKAVCNMRAIGATFEDISLMSSANAAKALGVFNDIGSIEPGKRADFVAVDEDVNVRGVILGGKMLKY